MIEGRLTFDFEGVCPIVASGDSNSFEDGVLVSTLIKVTYGFVEVIFPRLFRPC